MPPKRRKQKGKGIFGDAIRGIKKGAKWVIDNRAGIKQAHDYIKSNKIASRAARAIGSEEYAKKFEHHGYGMRGMRGAGTSNRVKWT
jgi:hypothetical protein